MISIVMPVHNEEKILRENLEKLEAYLQSLGMDFEIVLVENGSKDNTLKIAEEISHSDTRVRVLSIPEKDLGKALKKGILEASGEYLIWYPIDLSVGFEYIERSLEEVKKYDIIVGSKEHPDSKVMRSLTRRILSLFYNSLANLLFNLGISDTQCVKTFRAEKTKPLVEKTESSGIMWEVELLYLVKKSGLRMEEVPVSVRDTRKASKIKPMDMFKAFMGLLRLRLGV
ncbi:MAG: glycosyltransferase [Candidatus Altiarchaeota archaeon]|nr:glycosyltransferase [Candidatus Altiarchaeota archaeon]